MQKTRVITLTVLTLLFATAQAHADINTLITFDDLTGATNQIPSPYKGLQWSNFNFLDDRTFNHADPIMAGLTDGVVSEHTAAYNFGGFDAAFFVNPGSTFLLTSAFFTSSSNALNSVTVTGFLAGVTAFTQSFGINDQPVQETFGWTVDGVAVCTAGAVNCADPNFNNLGGPPVAIDNIQLGTANGAVPEPGAVFLLGTVGMALLPLVRRRAGRQA